MTAPVSRRFFARKDRWFYEANSTFYRRMSVVSSPPSAGKTRLWQAANAETADAEQMAGAR